MYLTITNTVITTLFFSAWLYFDPLEGDDFNDISETALEYNSTLVQECISALNDKDLDLSKHIWNSIEEDVKGNKNLSRTIMSHILSETYRHYSNEINADFSLFGKFLLLGNMSQEVQRGGFKTLLEEMSIANRVVNSSDAFTLANFVYASRPSISPSLLNSFPTVTIRKYLRNLGRLFVFKSSGTPSNGYIFPSGTRDEAGHRLVHLWKPGNYIVQSRWILHIDEDGLLQICSSRYTGECLSSNEDGSIFVAKPEQVPEVRWYFELLPEDTIRIKKKGSGESLVVGAPEFDANSNEARVFSFPTKESKGIWDLQAFF